MEEDHCEWRAGSCGSEMYFATMPTVSKRNGRQSTLRFRVEQMDDVQKETSIALGSEVLHPQDTTRSIGPSRRDARLQGAAFITPWQNHTWVVPTSCF